MKNRIRLLIPIMMITLFDPLFSFGQITNKVEMHHETLGDKYLPNAYGNKKTSPAYIYKSNSKARVSGAANVFTIQVNVNDSGQNILGDAANEPNIAVDPLDGNKIVIGWRQFDNVSSNFRQAGWSYTTDAGQHWTFPGVIDSGYFRSDPVLDYDKDGNFYFNSLALDFTCTIFKSTNGGASWDSLSYAYGGDKQWMTIDRTSGVGSGNIYASWTAQYSTCLPGYFTRSTTEGESFESCTEENGDSFWKMLAVGNSGELYVAGLKTNDKMVVAKSQNAQTPGSLIAWGIPVTINLGGALAADESINPGGLLGQVNIDVDRSTGLGRNNVYVMATVPRHSIGDPGDVMFVKSTDGGQTWSSPLRINDDNSSTNTQWMGTMSVAPNGRIDAVWLDTRDIPGSDSSALYYSYSMNQGATWSANEKLSDSFDPHVGYPDQNKMGDYFDMISDSSGAHLAWTNTLNGEEDVYYSHITPPIITGINDAVANNLFSIFPNPNNGKFTIYGESTQTEYLVEIYNMVGEKIYTGQLADRTTNEVDISTQPAGVYFVKVFDKNEGNKIMLNNMRVCIFPTQPNH